LDGEREKEDPSVWRGGTVPFCFSEMMIQGDLSDDMRTMMIGKPSFSRLKNTKLLHHSGNSLVQTLDQSQIRQARWFPLKKKSTFSREATRNEHLARQDGGVDRAGLDGMVLNAELKHFFHTATGFEVDNRTILAVG